MDDRELLQEFILRRNEQAFAEVVRRHIDLVYSAARRQSGDQTAAQDIAQAVFVLLIEKAHTIRDSEALAGWLLVSTRYVALNMLRGETRRRKHECEAAAMKLEAQSGGPQGNGPIWESVQPALDEAVAQLKPTERDALVLRYFEKMSLADVGAALGITEPAAQKRVNRAVHSLREFFTSRGINSSAEALSSVLLIHAIDPAPAALSQQVAQCAVSTAKVVSTTSSVTATKGAAIVMASTNTKTAVGAAIAIIVCLGGTAAIVLPRLSSPKAAPSTAPAPMVAESPQPYDWRPAFNLVYELEPNQNLKRVMPPFIPERLEFYRATAGQSQVDAIPRGADVMTFTWDGVELKRGTFGFGRFSLNAVLRWAGGVAPQDTDFPPELLSKTVEGDWVVRAGATTEQRMADFASLIQDVIGEGMTFKQEPKEREIIVVRGTFNFVKLEVDDPNNRSSMNRLYFFRGAAPDLSRRYGSSGGNIKSVIDSLGENLLTTMVIETELPENEFFAWQADQSMSFRRTMQQPESEAIDEILANVARQTSLQFTREKRLLPTWRLVKTNP